MPPKQRSKPAPVTREELNIVNSRLKVLESAVAIHILSDLDAEKPPATPKPPPVDPRWERAPIGPVMVRNSDESIQNAIIEADMPYQMENLKWAGGQGVSCDNAKHVKIVNSIINSYRYGLWPDGAEFLELDQVDVNSKPSGLGDGDAYCLRGHMTKYRSENCNFWNNGKTEKSKGLFRPNNCLDFESADDTFEGGRLMCGGGQSGELDDPQPFKGTFARAKINCKNVQVYKDSDTTFNDCDFAGTPEISVHEGGKATFIGCINFPKLTGDGEVVIE